jgi:uncharacterized Zn-binding protein involved in type VI secretion
MPAVARLGDTCTGHGCFPPRANTGSSPNVFADNILVHRQSDAWATHCCVVCHSSSLAAGSGTVFANNLQLGRVGDPVACGSSVATGSGTVFAGG